MFPSLGVPKLGVLNRPAGRADADRILGSTTTHQDNQGSSMTRPKRIQQRRTPGWRKPKGAISVARPHKWGNPFKVDERTAEEAVRLYREWLPGTDLYRDLSELTGHDLMCFCPLNQSCHADVLLELANP